MADIKGVLLCGGNGTRLRPMTEVINKHLIRVADLPMAEYPILKMIEAGIKEIMIVTGGENFSAVVKYFGSGRKWKIKIVYAIQDEAGGIAQALALAEDFIGNSRALVCLGDNLFRMNLSDEVRQFIKDGDYACTLFTSQTTTPERFGVLKFNGEEAVDVIEKPQEFISSWAVAGIYLYDSTVFRIIKTLRPSARGELEITDVNRFYIKAGFARIVKMDGWWSDCGTLQTIHQTEEFIKNDRPIPPVHPQVSH